MSENRRRKTKLRNTLGPCPKDDGVRESIVFHSGKSEWSFRGLLEPGSTTMGGSCFEIFSVENI